MHCFQKNHCYNLYTLIDPWYLLECHLTYNHENKYGWLSYQHPKYILKIMFCNCYYNNYQSLKGIITHWFLVNIPTMSLKAIIFIHTMHLSKMFHDLRWIHFMIFFWIDCLIGLSCLHWDVFFIIVWHIIIVIWYFHFFVVLFYFIYSSKDLCLRAIHTCLYYRFTQKTPLVDHSNEPNYMLLPLLV